jgi:hypothetical protein
MLSGRYGVYYPETLAMVIQRVKHSIKIGMRNTDDWAETATADNDAYLDIDAQVGAHMQLSITGL